MKHFRVLLPLLILALLLSGCGGESLEPYTYNVNDRTINIYPESGTIVDGLDVYHYTRTENHNGTVDYVITYPNGGRFNWTETENGGYGDANGANENMYLSGNTLIWALESGEPAEKVGNPFLGLLLMGLGALNFFFPELGFFLRYGWAVENAEPSDDFITWAKVCGVLAAVAGLVACFI